MDGDMVWLDGNGGGGDGEVGGEGGGVDGERDGDGHGGDGDLGDLDGDGGGGSVSKFAWHAAPSQSK